MELFTRYYGFDLLAVLFGFIAIYQVGDKKRKGFLFYILAACFGLAFAIAAKSIAYAIANIITIIMQLRAYIKWGKN